LRILILGSEGFIGGHCVAHFTSGNHDVAGADLFEQPSRDYSYQKISRLSSELDELLERQAFDAIINAAGSGNVPYSMTHPVLDFEANCLDTVRLLDGIRRHQPKCKYLHLSSAAVYGNPSRLPIAEEDETLPLSPYGWHKLMAEQLCKEYSNLFGLRTAIARPFSVYGPGLKKQMFWDLYQKTKSGGPIELIGTGKESRDYIHVLDLVHAFENILEKSAMNADVYNIASGEEFTIEKVVRIYFDALNIKNGYAFNGQVRKGDPLNWRADVGRLTALGFSCEIELKQGLLELGDWLKTI
jgi:nucleoside-diphosphate-sugar epimerase